MSQRHSEYKRQEADWYPTPAWCTELLAEKLRLLGLRPRAVWEPARGDDAMLTVLQQELPGALVLGTDIRDETPIDFLSVTPHDHSRWEAVITNPPYRKDLIRAFIDKALKVTQPAGGMVAMLLRVDFDSAKTRADIFGKHPAWFAKIVLNQRVVWFDHPDRKSAPSENHAWFIWNWSKIPSKPPIILYGPH